MPGKNDIPRYFCAREKCGHVIGAHTARENECNVAGCKCPKFLEEQGSSPAPKKAATKKAVAKKPVTKKRNPLKKKRP